MKKIIQYLKQHIKEDLHVPYYLSVFTFLIISIVINYTFQFNDNYIDALPGAKRIWANFLFFAFAYFVPLLLWCSFTNRWNICVNRDFLGKSLFGLALLALDSGFPYLTQWLDPLPPSIYYWAYKVGINLISGFTILLPLAIFHAVFEKNKNKLYGLGNTRFDWSPYLLMLLIMLPFISGAAAFSPGFQKQYPMYPDTQAHLFLHVPEWITILGYELAYGLDFITVELLFRGLFVIGLSAVLGRATVLAMASAYCFLHFGKPAGEAISSIFGGYLLGVIAYETRSIWGGIAVHVGIAWMMEICSLVQELFE